MYCTVKVFASLSASSQYNTSQRLLHHNHDKLIGISMQLLILLKACLVWSLNLLLSDIVLIEGLNNVAIKPEVTRLLLFFCCFPGAVAQVTASCIAQCGQKCKELKRETDGVKIRNNRHKKIERERKPVSLLYTEKGHRLSAQPRICVST